MLRNTENQLANLFYRQKAQSQISEQIFPKPFPYYCIALQQMHKMKSCKAQTMTHYKQSDQV